MNVEEELQRLLFDTLTGNGAIMALAYRVYDKVPTSPYGTKTAYISFGPIDASEDDADCIVGARITVQIDIWSKADGSLEAKQLVSLVRKALHHKSLALNDNALVDTHVEAWRVFTDIDRATTHGVVTVTAMVEEPD
jgi:hypothetical protein